MIPEEAKIISLPLPNCSDCGGQMSPRARACPHCGAPPFTGNVKIIELARDFWRRKAPEKSGISKDYYRNLKQQQLRFAEHFSTRTLEQVKAAEVETFLSDLKLAAKTTLNQLASIRILGADAKRRGLVPRDWDEFDKIVLMPVRPNPPRIYLPADMRKLLSAAQTWREGKMLAFGTLGAFTAIRHAELKRTDWRNVNLDADLSAGTGTVFLSRAITKTGSDRLVYIPPNAVAWLRLCQRDSGPICSYKNSSNALWRLQRAAGVGKCRNGLRKSCLTYQTALTENLETVSLRAGNSPAVLKRNYVAFAQTMKKAAEEWFSILPDSAQMTFDFSNKTTKSLQAMTLRR